MAFTLNAAAISSAVLHVPRWGAWVATVTLTDETVLVWGSRVTLTLGDLVLTGTVRDGGPFAGSARYTVIGGGDRWAASVDKRSYRDEGGPLLSRALSDLATDARELGAVLEPGVKDRRLGYAWARRTSLASAALDALTGGQWWIETDGVTHVGPRPVRAISPATLTIQRYDADLRLATVSLSDDAVAQLLPGAVLTAPGLPAPLTVAGCQVRVENDSIEVDLCGAVPEAELLRRIVAQLTAGTRYHPAYPCAVTEASGTRASVQALDGRAVELPAEPLLDQVPGLPGVSAVLQPGAGVLVAFPAGDPGSPVIVGYLPGMLPVSVAFNATTNIDLGGTSPLAKALEVDIALGQLRAAVNALGGAVPPLGSVACSKARGG